MLTSHRIKLLDLHFLGHGFFVLGGCVKVACALGGLKLDFFSTGLGHMVLLGGRYGELLRFAAGPKVSKHCLNPVLCDGSYGSIRNTQPYPATFALDPKTTVVKIGKKPTLGLVICVGYIVPDHWFFTGNLADTSHNEFLIIRSKPTSGQSVKALCWAIGH
jgi:hypothetical protein